MLLFCNTLLFVVFCKLESPHNQHLNFAPPPEKLGNRPFFGCLVSRQHRAVSSFIRPPFEFIISHFTTHDATSSANCWNPATKPRTCHCLVCLSTLILGKSARVSLEGVFLHKVLKHSWNTRTTLYPTCVESDNWTNPPKMCDISISPAKECTPAVDVKDNCGRMLGNTNIFWRNKKLMQLQEDWHEIRITKRNHIPLPKS